MRAVTLDLEDAQVCLRGLALQIEGRDELFLLRLRLLQPLLVLFLIDTAEVHVLLDIEAGGLHGIRRDRELGIVFGVRLFLLRAFLPNLLLEIAVLGAPVGGRLQLILAVEFHEELPGGDDAAAGHEPGNDEGVAARSGRADEPGRRNVVKTDGFDEAGHPQALDERAAGHLQRPISLTHLIVGPARADPADDGKPGDQDYQEERKQQMRFFHGV